MSSKEECHVNALQILTNEKHFPKILSQWEFDYGLFTNLPKIIDSNSEEISYLSWQNKYPNFKTTCHIKLKFFLWTKLLESLLLGKYLICRCGFKLNFFDA